MHTIRYTAYINGKSEILHWHNPMQNEGNVVFVPRVGDTLSFPNDGLNPDINWEYFNNGLSGVVSRVIITFPFCRDEGTATPHPSLHIEVIFNVLPPDGLQKLEGEARWNSIKTPTAVK